MRPGTVRELSRNRPGFNGALDDGWESSYYTFTDFAGFMAQLTPRAPWEPAEWARVAREVFEDQARLNVVYLEPSFDMPVREVGDDSRFWPIMDVLEEERRRAEALYDIRINYIAGIMRSFPPEVGLYRVELAAEARDRGYGIAGIDLHGDEMVGSVQAFVPAYRLAEDRGLGLRAHAGEALGPESVWNAMRYLGTRRIAHGVRSIEDPALIERLRRGDVTLEICPTSNVRTAVVRSIEEHPIRWLYDLSIPVTVSSDDPLPFFTDIEREYRLLVEILGFDLDDLRQINLYALNAAFLSDDERARFVARVNTAYDAARGHLSRTAG